MDAKKAEDVANKLLRSTDSQDSFDEQSADDDMMMSIDFDDEEEMKRHKKWEREPEAEVEEELDSDEEELWTDSEGEEESEEEESSEEEVDDTPRISYEAFQAWIDETEANSDEYKQKVKKLDSLHRGMLHLTREDIVAVINLPQCTVSEEEAIPMAKSYRKRHPFFFSIHKLDSYWDSSAGAKDREFTFICDTAEEKEAWFKIMEKSIEFVNESGKLGHTEQDRAKALETSRTVLEELNIIAESSPEVRFRFFQVHDVRAAQIATGEIVVENGIGADVFGVGDAEQAEIDALTNEDSKFQVDDISLNLFPPEHKFRRMCQFVVDLDWPIYIPKFWKCSIKAGFARLSFSLPTVMVVVVLFNSFVIAAEGPEYLFVFHTPLKKKLLLYADMFCFVCFFFESFVKIIGMGFLLTPNAYLLDSWNRLDFFVVCISCFDYFCMAVSLDVGSLTGVMKLLRILRPLKLLNMIPSMGVVLDSITAAIPAASGIITLVILSFLIFGIFGVTALSGRFFRCMDATGKDMPYNQKFTTPIEVFHSAESATFPNSMVLHHQYDKEVCENPSICNGDFIAPYLGQYDGPCQWGNPQYHFDNVWAAFKTLFGVWTIGGWVEIMQISMDVTTLDMAPQRNNTEVMGVYYVLFMIFVGYMLRSLFIAVLVDFFAQSSGSALTTQTQKNWQQMTMITSRMQPRRSPPIHGCLCISLENRIYCYNMTNSTLFTNAINATIIVQMGIMLLPLKLWPDYVSGWFYEIQRLILLVWTFEMIAKIIALGVHVYISKNTADFSIILILYLVQIKVAIDTFWADDPAVRDIMQYADVVNIFEFLRVVRLNNLLKRSKRLRNLMTTIVISIPQAINIMIILLLVFYIFGVLGMKLYGGFCTDITKYKDVPSSTGYTDDPIKRLSDPAYSLLDKMYYADMPSVGGDCDGEGSKGGLLYGKCHEISHNYELCTAIVDTNNNMDSINSAMTLLFQITFGMDTSGVPPAIQWYTHCDCPCIY